MGNNTKQWRQGCIYCCSIEDRLQGVLGTLPPSLVLSSEGHIEARTSIQPYEVYINNKILYEPCCQVANVWERRSALLTLMNNAIYTPVNRRNLYYIVILFSVSCLLLLIYYHHFRSFHSVPLISNTDHFHIQSIGIRSPHVVFE